MYYIILSEDCKKMVSHKGHRQTAIKLISMRNFSLEFRVR